MGAHSIKVYKFGDGPKLVIALHGFADKGLAFQKMADHFGEQYTFLCPDLPFHGDTLWNDKEFTPENIEKLILLILQKNGNQTFSLMGHSMGGRIALHLIKPLASNIEKLFLLAPAGVNWRWYYSQLVVPNFVVRGLSKLLLQLNETPWIYTALHKLGFVDGQSYHFFKKQFDAPFRKARLAGVWRSLCHFPVVPQKTVEIIAQLSIPLEIWVGERDRIIPPSDAYHFQKLYPPTVVKVVEGKNHFSLMEG